MVSQLRAPMVGICEREAAGRAHGEAGGRWGDIDILGPEDSHKQGRGGWLGGA